MTSDRGTHETTANHAAGNSAKQAGGASATVQDIEIAARREILRGAAYDLRAFDDAVVKGGNAPLDVLAKNVDRYIAAARG